MGKLILDAIILDYIHRGAARQFVGTLFMRRNDWQSPAVNPFGSFWAEIDASMTLRGSIVVVPVGSV